MHFSPNLVIVLSACGIGGVAAMMTNIPAVQIVMVSLLVAPGPTANVVSAVAVERYPTSVR